ncbi:MAG: DUF192 domain-containing protein [Candidatus Nomurabacteria bacterium]|nr:MAG: DUF192 domain-containing protein [Candidatus Nomurabacteria bacterium]
MQRRFFIGLIVVLLGLAAGIVWWLWFAPVSTSGTPTSGDGQAKLTIHEHEFLVDLAIRSETQATGLAYRDDLASDRGMLFLFTEPQRLSFWMKGMRFPLDIIWIRDQRVIAISPEVPLAPRRGILPTYAPKSPADAVLEVRAGLAKNLGISVGDTVSWEILTSE